MEEQDVIQIWKRSSQKEEITIDAMALMKDFKQKMEFREDIVRKRDRKETFFAILGIFGFAILTARMWFSVPALGMLFIALTYCYYIYKLWSNRKSKYTENLFMSLKQQLENQKQFMINQAKLLNSVMYWALLPFFVGYMVVIWSVWDLDTVNFSSFISSFYPEKLKSKIVYTTVFLIAFIYNYWTNKKAVKINWEPLIKQIDMILDNLKHEEE